MSAVTTTGLIIADTGTYFNRFGQSVIMVLFQVGGLGYMVFISLAVLGFAGKLSMSSRILLKESISRPTSIALTISEEKDFIKIVFEVGSALGTVGLSAGITADLTVFGKIVIIITMLIGRVGPLGIGLTILRRKKIASYQYPEDEILVG